MKIEGYMYGYPRPAVATDCVVFGFDGKNLKVLLVERGREPYIGKWALPGGFMRMEETADVCAVRELKEETSLELKEREVEQVGAFTAVRRHPGKRVISIAYYAALAREKYNIIKDGVHGGDDAVKADWFNVKEVGELAFDHKEILLCAMGRLKENLHTKPDSFSLLGDSFTMSELHSLYEAIVGKELDKRNFSKKMLSAHLLEEVEVNEVVERTAVAKRGPKGKLYRFSKEVEESRENW